MSTNTASPRGKLVAEGLLQTAQNTRLQYCDVRHVLRRYCFVYIVMFFSCDPSTCTSHNVHNGEAASPLLAPNRRISGACSGRAN